MALTAPQSQTPSARVLEQQIICRQRREPGEPVDHVCMSSKPAPKAREVRGGGEEKRFATGIEDGGGQEEPDRRASRRTGETRSNVA